MKLKFYNPGGIGRVRLAERMDIAVERRKHYPASEKLQILSSVASLMKNDNMTQNQASIAMQVCPSQVSRWRACADDLAASVESGWDKLKLNQGPVGLLDDVEHDLVTFVDEWRTKGLPVSRLSLVRKACQLSPAFSEKSLQAQKMAISRIMARNNLAHRMSTHWAQRPPEEVSQEALGYLEVMVPIVNDSNRLPEFTANMDQTPMWHAMSQKGSIDTIGKRTINVRTSVGDSKRVTVAVTITASGHQLPSMIVFKGKRRRFLQILMTIVLTFDCRLSLVGKPKGRIAMKEIATLPDGAFYRVNEKAWFTEAVMLDWVEVVLAPWAAKAPPGIVPILLLDQFKVHMMASVVDAIQALGVQVEFIAAGCTGLLQPVDVGYNKSFKAKMREEYTSWMLAQDADLPIPRTTRRQLSEWIISAQKNVTAETIRNAWRKSGYSYYPAMFVD
jgi:hypothetical protein